MENSTQLGLQDQAFWLGHFLMEVNVFPVFLFCDFALACLDVREDAKVSRPKFAQNHPLASWLCTVMAGLSGVFVANFLYGDPLVDILKEETLIIFITVIWYLMNYSPFDIVYKLALFPPVILLMSVLQECVRVRFIYLGLHQAARTYPQAKLIMLLGGTIKGNGYGFIRIVERLVRGKWSPTTNDFLDVTYFAKSALYASFAFLLHHLQFLTLPIEILYLIIVTAFVLLRMAIIIFKVQDPLLPLETPLCILLFGRGGSDTVGKQARQEKDKLSPSKSRENNEKVENKKVR